MSKKNKIADNKNELQINHSPEIFQNISPEFKDNVNCINSTINFRKKDIIYNFNLYADKKVCNYFPNLPTISNYLQNDDCNTNKKERERGRCYCNADIYEAVSKYKRNNGIVNNLKYVQNKDNNIINKDLKLCDTLHLEDIFSQSELMDLKKSLSYNFNDDSV